jgi:hypothetical protein
MFVKFFDGSFYENTECAYSSGSGYFFDGL